MTRAIESTAKANKGLIKRLIKRLPVNLPRASEFMNREGREEGRERTTSYIFMGHFYASLPSSLSRDCEGRGTKEQCEIDKVPRRASELWVGIQNRLLSRSPSNQEQSFLRNREIISSVLGLPKT